MSLKATVHLKRKILLSFTPPQVVLKVFVLNTKEGIMWETELYGSQWCTKTPAYKLSSCSEQTHSELLEAE